MIPELEELRTYMTDDTILGLLDRCHSFRNWNHGMPKKHRGRVTRMLRMLRRGIAPSALSMHLSKTGFQRKGEKYPGSQTGIARPRPINVKPHTHPWMKQIIAAANEENLTFADLERVSGVAISTIRLMIGGSSCKLENVLALAETVNLTAYLCKSSSLTPTPTPVPSSSMIDASRGASSTAPVSSARPPSDTGKTTG
jgi:hypothetical protein